MPCRSRRNSSCCNIAKNERTNGFFHITSGAMASFLPAGLVQMKLFGECHRWSVAPNPCQNDRPNGQRHIGAEQGVSINSSIGWKACDRLPFLVFNAVGQRFELVAHKQDQQPHADACGCNARENGHLTERLRPLPKQASQFSIFVVPTPPNRLYRIIK